tara:strand:- start:127 stop:558 length:432 start_codon:yes stop_codon:yes gene_type:complete
MIENFNGPIYFILFIILLLANLYYAYSTLINSKKWLDQYGTHHSALIVTRILGSVISGFVLIGVYILFTSTAGTWSYFATLFISYLIMSIIGIYSVEVDYPNNYKGKEGFEKVIVTKEGYVPAIIFTVITAIIIYGLSDKIYI